MPAAAPHRSCGHGRSCPGQRCPLLGRGYESLALEAAGTSGLSRTVTQDEERMTVPRNKFHMIDACSRIFLSSVRKAHVTRRKSGLNKGGWGEAAWQM